MVVNYRQPPSLFTANWVEYSGNSKQIEIAMVIICPCWEGMSMPLESHPVSCFVSAGDGDSMEQPNRTQQHMSSATDLHNTAV